MRRLVVIIMALICGMNVVVMVNYGMDSDVYVPSMISFLMNVIALVAIYVVPELGNKRLPIGFIEELADQYPDEELLIPTGYAEAVIGVDSATNRVVISYEKMIQIDIDNGMSHEESIEWHEYNTINAYVGENTPIYVDSLGYELV